MTRKTFFFVDLRYFFNPISTPKVKNTRNLSSHWISCWTSRISIVDGARLRECHFGLETLVCDFTFRSWSYRTGPISSNTVGFFSLNINILKFWIFSIFESFFSVSIYSLQFLPRPSPPKLLSDSNQCKIKTELPNLFARVTNTWVTDLIRRINNEEIILHLCIHIHSLIVFVTKHVATLQYVIYHL